MHWLNSIAYSWYSVEKVHEVENGGLGNVMMKGTVEEVEGVDNVENPNFI